MPGWECPCHRSVFVLGISFSPPRLLSLFMHKPSGQGRSRSLCHAQQKGSLALPRTLVPAPLQSFTTASRQPAGSGETRSCENAGFEPCADTRAHARLFSSLCEGSLCPLITQTSWVGAVFRHQSEEHASPPGRGAERTSGSGAGQLQVTLRRSHSFVIIPLARTGSSLPPGAPSAAMAAVSPRGNVLPRAAAPQQLPNALGRSGARRCACTGRAGAVAWRCSALVATLPGDESPGSILRVLVLVSVTLHKCFLCTSVSFAQVFPCPVFLHLLSAVRCPDPKCQKVFGVGSHPPPP